jgi:hypothetical protein
VRVRRAPFTAAMPCRKGSDWFALAREVYDDLVQRVEGAPELVEYFRHSYCPNEAFFHTLLLPHWAERNAGVNLHYLRFDGTAAHPDVLTDDDWDAICSSGRYFARKFDGSSGPLLDRLDSQALEPRCS